MPRPNLSSKGKSASNSAKSSNPFSNWLATRKERRMEAEDEAAKLITNTIASNQNTIIDKLSSIDFLHSRLPESVLNTMSNPKQGCCDLEYATRVLIHKLAKDPQIIKMDIRKFDQKLLTLVLLFKQAVEQGDVRAAYAAKGALVRGINDIRSRIPQSQPELARQFVEANVDYMDQWITLVTLAQVADRTKQNVDNQRQQFEAAEKHDQELNDALRERFTKDNAYAVAFNELMDHEMDADRTKWTATQREVHQAMVKRRMGKVNLELNSMLLQQQEMDLHTKEAQVNTLYASVTALKIVADPNLMSKYQDDINKLFHQMAESDAQIDETMKSMDDIQGRIQQLNHAPGALRAMEVAAEEAERAAEELRKQEEDVNGKNAERARKARERLGLHSKEQLEELRQQREEEELRMIQEMEQMQAQEQVEVEEERELLSN